jgi:hypothetical protein
MSWLAALWCDGMERVPPGIINRTCLKVDMFTHVIRIFTRERTNDNAHCSNRADIHACNS